MKPLSLEWTQGMKPEPKKSFEDYLRNSTQLIQRLQKIQDRWTDDLEKDELSDDFSSDWAYRQAQRVGQKKQLKKLKDLLSFLE